MNYEQEESQQLRKYTKQLIIDSYFLHRPIPSQENAPRKKENNNDVIQENIHEMFSTGTAAMCASALTGCASSDDAPWTATYDESLGLLAAGPNEDVIMGNAWMLRDNGTVQLQFAAGSMPFLPSNPPACRATVCA